MSLQVSVDEWCNMWDAYAKDPSSVMDWQTKYMNFMFDLEDASTDGSIDVEEFTLVCSSYGLDKAECQDAFQKMAQVCTPKLPCLFNITNNNI